MLYLRRLLLAGQGRGGRVFVGRDEIEDQLRGFLASDSTDKKAQEAKVARSIAKMTDNSILLRAEVDDRWEISPVLRARLRRRRGGRGHRRPLQAGGIVSQHRLRRVQVVNWGTFGGEWSFAVPWKGMLLTGPSGAGKSSLLDAMAALLVPPGRMRFNAAAQGTDTGDRERSLLTYVRGAHKRETDEETGEVGTAFLRKGPTWSAVALTFVDAAGTVTTLVRLFHIRGSSSTARRDLKSMYILAPEPVDVLTLKSYVENGIENRRVSAAFPHWDCYSADAYTAFSTKFRRLLGIGCEQAQVLLHKTQSAKNLTNLDALFRDFMLDVPETFKLSDATVEQFEELALGARLGGGCPPPGGDTDPVAGRRRPAPCVGC